MRSKWVPARIERLIGVRRAGAMVLPADRSPFAFDDRGKEPLVALFVGGARATGKHVEVELAAPPGTMGMLAGRMRGAAEEIGPEAVAQFVAAFDQAAAFQQDQ